MPLVIPNGFGIARLRFSLAGKPDPMFVTFGVTIPSEADPSIVASTIRLVFLGEGRPLNAVAIAAGYAYDGVEVTKATPSGPIVGASLVTTVGVGGIAVVPPNCAMLMRKQTARGGRKGRGRAYWPPMLLPDTQIDAAGNIDPSNVGSLQTAFSDAMEEWIDGLYPPVILHADNSTPNVLTGVSIQGQLATQRRRLR